MIKFKNAFRAFRYRNFRLFFPGLALSQIGIWIQNTAINWLLYEMTGSAFYMGCVLFFCSIPLLVVTPFAGFIADKFNKQKLLLIVQILFSVQSLILVTLSFFGLLRVWNITILGIFLNLIAAVDNPLRQSSYICTVKNKKDLGNALSLNSTCFNLARLLGPALFGIIIAKTNINICFLVNFLFVFSVIFLIANMNLVEKKSEKIQHETVKEGLKEGFSYCFKTPNVSLLLIYLASFCFFIMIYPVLIPIYTKDVLLSDAKTLGTLLGYAGVGAFIGSALLATKTTTKYLRRHLFVGLVLVCFCFIGLGISHDVFIAKILLFGIGLGSSNIITPQNMLLQSFIDDDIRGRVVGINAIANLGATTFSSFFAGSISHVLGIQNAFIVLACSMLCIGMFLSVKLFKLKY